jgi:diguanylate cyclase (GGDEF)-like protein/PAS domain S-box-containing protein
MLQPGEQSNDARRESDRQSDGEALSPDERRLHDVMDSLSSSVFVGLMTVDGILTYANRAALDAVGTKPEDVVGKPFDAAPWWAHSEAIRQRLVVAIRAAAAGAVSRFEFPFRDIHGRLLTMDFTLHPVFGQDGRVAYLIPSAHDITERKQAERALRLTQFAIDHAHSAVFQGDPGGALLYANDSASRLLGYRRETLLGMPIHKFNTRVTEAGWPEVWNKLKTKGSLQFESIYRRFDGSEIPVGISANYIEYDGEGFSFTFVADLSERKAAEERIHYLAHYDGLTGLPNRDLLRDRLAQTIAYADRHREPIWVVSVDLDRFKFISDTLGQDSGDMLLKTVAERMRSAIRDVDTLARIGGDKFVLVLADNFDNKLGVGVVQRIMQAVAQPLAIRGDEVFLTCSIGLAVYPTDGEDAETLLKHADIAGNRAKEMGRNNFQFYTSTMNERALERLHLQGDLREAIEREQFVLHYQPQVDLRTGRIIGMEALIRWEHPELGMLSPARFIGLAEETGLIVPMGKWVTRTACAQNKAWQQAGLGNLRVAVNLSAVQFGQPDFVQSIATVLQDTGLEPQYLELELTESLVMTEVEHAIEILRDLKALGVQLSIDDFGTGYSSLSYLKRFPIDVLKIDQSFVRDMMDHPEDAAIVASIVSLAHSLRLHVVAEGVEAADQLAYLQRQGCDAMQGYFFSRPVTAEAFEKLLREGKCLADMA